MRRLVLALSLLAGLVVLAPRAHAQDTAGSDDNAAAEGGDTGALRAGQAEHPTTAEAPEDPSAHFNYASHWFDYRHLDTTGDKLGNGMVKGPDGQLVHTEDEEPMSPPFVLYVFNFLIFYWLLIKYLWPPAKQVAKDRHDQIKTALEEAAALRKQAADKLADYEKRIKDVDAEIEALVAGIRSDAEADKARILEAAKRQAEQMKKDAELRIAAEIELARARLAEEVSAAASAATEKLLRERTTPDDQRKLVSTFISGMGGN